MQDLAWHCSNVKGGVLRCSVVCWCIKLQLPQYLIHSVKNHWRGNITKHKALEDWHPEYYNTVCLDYNLHMGITYIPGSHWSMHWIIYPGYQFQFDTDCQKGFMYSLFKIETTHRIYSQILYAVDTVHCPCVHHQSVWQWNCTRQRVEDKRNKPISP